MAAGNGQKGKPLTVKQEQFFQVIVKGLSRAEEGTGHHYRVEVNVSQVEGFNFSLAVGGLGYR